MAERNLTEDIRRAEEEIRVLAASEENKRRFSYWAGTGKSNDYWHGIPDNREQVPFVVELERATYSHVIGFDLKRLYTEPEYYYLNALKTSLFKYKTFDDCTPITRQVNYWSGVGFEKSIFGGEQIYSDNDSWLAREAVFTGKEDISSLPLTDFYTSGCMPDTIKFYEDMRGIAADDFTVTFPPWGRSPWGVAWHLCGLDNLCYLIADDYEWVESFIKYITECRKHWTGQMADYLKVPITSGPIYNDEVTFPMLSPKTYRELVLPTEIDLSIFHGGISYWHSCGNTTAFFHLINSIPNLQMVCISPWSDYELAPKVYGRDKILEFALHPYEDVINPNTRSETEDKLRKIKNNAQYHISYIQANGIQFLGGVDEGIRLVQNWISMARDVLG